MENLSFRDWSHWFEEGMSNYNHDSPEKSKAWENFWTCKPHVLAVMAWIVSAADSVGTGFSVRDHKSIADDIRASAQMVEFCVEALARVGLLDLCDDHPAGRLCLRVSFPHDGAPVDQDRTERLIKELPWHGGSL